MSGNLKKIIYLLLELVIAGVSASSCTEDKNYGFLRPCPDNKVSCISEYFQSLGAKGPKSCDSDNELHIPSFNIYLPFFNMTVVQNNLRVMGLDNGVVEEFYIDQTTGRMVLTLGFKDIIFKATTGFGYHAKGKEMQNIETNNTELYPFVSTTTVFRHADQPDLDLSSTQADVNSTLQYDIGTGVSGCDDPEIKERFKYFGEHIDVAVLDCFFTRAPMMASYFIQNHISDYGLDYTYINFWALNRP